MCESYDALGGPELAKALSILTGTQSARRSCSYNPQGKFIFFPASVVTRQDGLGRIMSHSRRDPKQLRRGIIRGEAWAISASRQTSRLPESGIVLMADDLGNVTECSDTIGKISSYKDQTCMELYDKKNPQTPFAYVIPSGKSVVTQEMKGEGDGGWSVTSIRNGCGTLVDEEPSMDAQEPEESFTMPAPETAVTAPSALDPVELPTDEPPDQSTTGNQLTVQIPSSVLPASTAGRRRRLWRALSKFGGSSGDRAR
jgi:hypothetical protein